MPRSVESFFVLLLDLKWTHHFVRLTKLFLDSSDCLPVKNLLLRFHGGDGEMRVQQTSAVSIRPRSRDRHGSSWLLGPLVLGAEGAGATKLQLARTPSNPA